MFSIKEARATPKHVDNQRVSVSNLPSKDRHIDFKLAVFLIDVAAVALCVIITLQNPFLMRSCKGNEELHEYSGRKGLPQLSKIPGLTGRKRR